MLSQKLKKDLKQAMKEKNQDLVRTLRFLRSSIINQEKEKRYKIAQDKKGLSEQELEKKSELTDEEVMEVLFSELKKRKESIEEFQKGGREDLVENERAELKIIKDYLPQQLSEQEIEKEVEAVVQKTGAQGPRDIGKVMSVLMPRLKGRADGALVSKVVKQKLS